MTIIRLSTNCLVNVSIRKINVGKGFFHDGHNGLPYVPRYCIQSEARGSLVPESLEPRPNLKKSNIYFATASTPTSKP